MRKSIAAFFAFIAISTVSEPVRADVPTARASVLVVPFRNAGGARGQDYLQLGFPLIVTERLEDLPDYDVVSGPLVLTPETAALEPKALTRSRTADLDLAAASRVAKAAGATYFVTGSYSGQEWNWKLEVGVYAVSDPPKLLASEAVTGDLTVEVPRKRGKPLRVVSMDRIHALLAEAAQHAFASAGLPSSMAVHDALNVPSTKDSWAFINFCRAIERQWNPQDPRHHRRAIDIAEYAVRVDPAFEEAQRFYAFLLEGDGKALKARLHYELALAKRPKDVRVLMRIGGIELAAGNAEIARDYLSKAASARPYDAETHARLAEADVKLGDAGAAVKEYEKVRDLAPRRLADRKALAALYCRKARYSDAVGEYRAIVAADSADANAAFLLGAALRKDGDAAGAVQAYADAAGRFPKEKRFGRYRDGLDDMAALADAIGAGTAIVATIEEIRSNEQAASNDAVLDFSLKGKEACAAGRGASSALLAKGLLERYGQEGDKLLASAALVKASFSKGDAAALTPDESEAAGSILSAAGKVPLDKGEMTSQFTRTLKPLADKAGCTSDVLAKFFPDTIVVVASRDGDRQVPILDVKPTPGSAVVVEPARKITFTIDNALGSEDYAVVLDGVEIGTVPAGAPSTDFIATVGSHTLCLVPKAPACGNQGTVRSVFLNQGWTLTVKPGRKT